MDPMQSALQAKALLEDVEKARQQKEKLDYDSKTSQIKSAAISAKQLELIKQANELAMKAQESSKKSEKETRIAKRHAIWANIIGLLAIIVAIWISQQ